MDLQRTQWREAFLVYTAHYSLHNLIILSLGAFITSVRTNYFLLKYKILFTSIVILFKVSNIFTTILKINLTAILLSYI